MLDYKKQINPLFDEIDVIKDFSKVQKETEIFKKEYDYLEPVAQKLISEILKDYKNIERMAQELERQVYEIQSSTGDDHSDAVSLYNQMLRQLENRIKRINLDLEKLNIPYFGKVKFQRDSDDKEITAYIGKFGIFDSKTNKMMVTDWRAPIANLYYQNSGPAKNVSFITPVAKQTGDLIQKRQFAINRCRINNIYDAKTGNIAADEFLLSQLKERIGKKLQDIVSTIQAQQNEIIREDIDKTVIIQGVAGSGKTTILLHKIAYLLFKHQDKIEPKKSIIIAPNKMFLDYISDVLPSLGIENLEHNTFLFWAKNILNWNEKFAVSTTKDDLNIKKLKGSYNFKLLVEEYFKSFEEDFLENIPSTMRHDIADKYEDLKKQHSKISMQERVELAINYAAAQKQFRKNLSEGYVAPIQGMKDQIQIIQDYVKKKYNPHKIYRNMFEYIKESKYFSTEELQRIKKYNRSTLISKKGFNYYKVEDLPPIIWIYFQIFGKTTHIKDCILADEAQDLSHFQILILNEIAKNNNLTLAGDLAQSIIPPFYIKNWEEVIEIIKKENKNINISYHKLHRCYRTTIEIIDFANSIFKKHFPKEFVLPEAVLRHGEPVERIKTNDIGDLIKIINKEFKNDIASLAIICRDIHHANEVYQKFIERKDEVQRQILSHDEDNYESGLLILPVEKAKGLEFDTVIIADMTEENYKKTELDIRLFYVAVTRALHKLYIHIPKNKKASSLL